MIDHLPECIYAPRNVDPDKGIAWGGLPCICHALRACEQRVWRDADLVVSETYKNALEDSVRVINTYADETHQHVGIDKCWPESGDRCDITAALRVAAQKIEAFHVYEEGSNLTAGSTVGSFLNKGDEIPDTEELSLKHELGQNQPKNGDE